MNLERAKEAIESAVKNQELLLVLGTCYVEYLGRAASKLPKGKRLLMLKGDGSFAIHQNKKLNAINYMINSSVSCELNDSSLEITAKKNKPKETLKVFFYQVDFVNSFPIEETTDDIRLVGSEKQISDQLMKDLSFIEEGLVPVKQESHLRKGSIDILAQDKNGKLVVVEVKRRKADFAAVTQLQRYMKQVEKLKGIETRGLLVAPEITKHANELLENYGLEFVEIDFEIGNNQPTKIKGAKKKQPTIMEYLK